MGTINSSFEKRRNKDCCIVGASECASQSADPQFVDIQKKLFPLPMCAVSDDGMAPVTTETSVSDASVLPCPATGMTGVKATGISNVDTTAAETHDEPTATADAERASVIHLTPGQVKLLLGSWKQIRSSMPSIGQKIFVR